jgi:hypothetical protein
MNNPNLTADTCEEQRPWTTDQKFISTRREGVSGVVLIIHNKNRVLVVHYAALQGFYSVEDVVDAYKDGDADFHKIVADMANIPRTQAKTINLGLFYGMGKNKLQAELGVNKLQAEELFKQYHSKGAFC